MAVIFDGTTHVCEAMVVVLRYVDDDWKIKQLVCRLMLLAKSMTGEEVAHQLIATLSTELSIPANCGSIHERSGVGKQCGYENCFHSLQLHDRYRMFLSYA